MTKMRKERLLAALCLALALAVAVAMPASAGQSPAPEKPEPADTRSKDPVCNLMVRNDPDLSVEHGGKVYYFCMKRDLEAFEKDPDKYLEGGRWPHQHPDPDLAG